MKRKFMLIFSIIFVFAMALTILAPAINLHAATGNSLFTIQSGSATIESTINGKGGAELVYGKEGKRASVKYDHLLDSSDISVFMQFITVHFDRFLLRFSDTYNTTKYLEICIRPTENGFVSWAQDNYSNKTPEIEFTTPLLDAKLELGYKVTGSGDKGAVMYIKVGSDASKQFDVSNLQMRSLDTSSDLKQLTFDNNDTNLLFTVADQTIDDDTRIMITGIKMFGNIQLLDNKAEGYVLRTPVLKRRQGLDQNQTEYIFKGNYNKTYTFPVYVVDVLGDYTDTWVVAPEIGNLDTFENIPDYPADWGSSVYRKTSHTLDNKGWYMFKISVGDNANETVFLKVFCTDETTAPTFNVDGVKQKVAEMLPNRVLNAPKRNNTFEFPSLRSTDLINLSGSIDTLYNIKIQLGYRRPGSTGAWTYCDANEVQLNAVGTWTFTYKIVDSAGNESTLGETFVYIVNDIYPPEIEADRNIDVVINTDYTIPNPTVTDNASGVDTTKTEIRLYTKDGVEVEITDNTFRPNKLTPDGEMYSYYVTYKAVDKYGNATEEEILSYIRIVAYTGDPLENAANDIVEIALIVTACVAGAGLIVLLFVSIKTKSI